MLTGTMVPGIVLMTLAGPALAAPAAAPAAPAEGQGHGTHVSRGLAEIVVTAQKRSEDLQKVPLSVSAFSAGELDMRGISETKDLSAIAPNISVLGGTTNATTALVTIRGIPTSGDESIGYDSPIGIYMDGVYLARSTSASFDIAEIERVEVLRGPQGTLFGRNTTGGAINFITKRPTDDFGVSLRAGAGNRNQKIFRGILNTGTIGGFLRSSLSYLYKGRDGVVDNLLQPSRLDPGAYKTHSLRWALTADLGDKVTFTNIFDWSRVKSVAPVQQLVAAGNGSATDYPPTLTLDGHVFPKVQPANVTGYLQEAVAGEPECGTPLSQMSASRRSTVCNNWTEPSIDKVWGNMTRIEADLDRVTIRSTTAFRWWRNRLNANDLDGLGTVRGPAFSEASLLNGMPLSALAQIPGLTPAAQAALAGAAVPTNAQDLFRITDERRQHQFSQELEIVSPSGGAFEWVAGAFYFKESGREYNPQDYSFVLDTDTIFTEANFGAAAAALRAGNPARFRAMPVPAAIRYSASTRSIALYGQATWRPAERLGITFGLRHSWDRKETQVQQNGTAPFAVADLPRNTGAQDFHAFTGNLAISYELSDAVNLYARIARGYRSGGFDVRQDTSLIPLSSFNPEYIWSYEAGVKTSISDRARFNAAFFYNVYSDQLISLPVASGEGQSYGSIIVNAGKTRYIGFELDGTVLVAPGLELDGSFGYVDAKPVTYLADDISHTPRNVAAIIKMDYVPKVTAHAGVTYSQPLGGKNLRVHLGYSYTSSFTMFGNPLNSPFMDDTGGDARGLLDGQIRLDRIALGGVEAGISIWGKNLTNKAYAVRAVDFGQLGFATASYGDPRTFGMTLDVRF